MDTASLIEACKAGDPEAIERLVRAHQQAVYRLALSILDDPAEADEAVQDSFVAALQALRSYQNRSAFKTWLFAIALNVCRTRLRRRAVRRRLEGALQSLLLQSPPPADPEQAAVQHEGDAAVWRAVDRLDEKHRLPILLRYYHDLSVAEIAEVLRLREGTVHSRLHTARERLREALNDSPSPERCSSIQERG